MNKEQIKQILRESLVNVKKIDTPEKWLINTFSKLNYYDDPDEKSWEYDNGTLKGIIYFYYPLNTKKLYINNDKVYKVLIGKWKMKDKEILNLLKKVFIEKYGCEIKSLAYIYS